MSDVQSDVSLIAHIRAIDEGASQTFTALRSVAGGTGVALVAAFVASAQSALQYSQAVEKVSFLTGQSTQKASALIAAFRAQGFTTDEATTSMQRLTMRLGAVESQFKATGKASAANIQTLKDMGISMKDLTSSGGDLTILLPKIIDHMKNMTDPLERDRLAMQLFGRNFGSIAPLIEAGGAAFTRATGDAKLFGVELSGAQVSAFHAWKAAQETSKEALSGITIQLGQYALPALMAVENAIKSGVAWWQRLSPAVKDTTIKVAGLVAVFGTLSGGATAVSGVLKTVTSNMGPLGLLLGSVAEPLLMLAAVIGLVVGAFLLLRNEYEHSIAIQQAFAPVIQGVKFAFEELRVIMGQVIDIAIGFFSVFTGDGRGSLDAFITSLAGPLINALGQVHVFLGRVMQFLDEHKAAIIASAGAVKNFAGELGKFLLAVGSPFLDFFKTVADLVTNTLVPALSKITWPAASPAVMSAWQFFKDQGKPIGDALLLIAGAFVAWNIALAAYNTYIFVTEALTQGWIAAQVALDVAMDANPVGLVVIAIVALIGVLIWAYRNVGPFRDVVNMLFATLAGFVGWVTGTAVPAVTGFAQAIIAAVGGLFSWIGTTFNNLVALAESAWKQFTSRPIYWIVFLVASVVMWVGNLEISLGQKFLALVTNVAGIMAALPGKILTFLIGALVQISLWERNLITTGSKAGGSFITSVINEVKKLPGQVLTFVTSVINTVVTQTPTLAAKGLKMAKDFISAVVGALASLPGQVNAIIGTAFGSIAGQVHQALHDAHFPGFAQGAVVGPGFGGARMAVVGEGNEAEVIAKASSLIKAGMQAASGGGGGGGYGNITVEYHVDGRLIEKSTSKITGQRMRLQGAGLGSGA